MSMPLLSPRSNAQPSRWVPALALCAALLLADAPDVLRAAPASHPWSAVSSAGALTTSLSIRPKQTVRLEPDSPSALTLKTERVVVFKDGYGLTVHRATAIADASGRVSTRSPPAGAVLGAYWATPVTPGITIKAMKAEEREAEQSQSQEGACASLAELLKASKDQRLELIRKDAEPVTGRLLETLVGANLVVIATDQGRRVVPIGTISEVKGANVATRCTTTKTSQVTIRELTFDLGPSAAGKSVELRLFAFSEGIRWVPTYRVHAGETPGRSPATVELTGELINELTDIDGPVDFVVGVPHFKFKNVPSPLSLERVMRRSLAAAAPQLMGNAAVSNAQFFQARSGEVVQPSSSHQPGADIPAAVSGADAHELFVYTTDRLTLAKGARASVPLLTHSVPVETVYSARLAARPASEGVTNNPVWHNLRLTNDGKTPWTTGPALVLSGGLPLGQDLLTFTPAGKQTLLPVTQATTVRAIVDETELSSEPNALRRNHRTYAKSSRKATVIVSNTKARPVSIEVTLTASGTLKGKVSGASVRTTAGVLNPSLETRWTLVLKPGESRELSMRYTTYR